MKNLFKEIKRYAHMVDEHDKFIKDQTANKFMKAWEDLQKMTFAEWDEKNPPKFKYGDPVIVFRIAKSYQFTGTERIPVYSGKIISIVKVIKHMHPDNFNDALRYNVDFKWSCKGEHIYCIDAGDMKYHEAKESEMEIEVKPPKTE